MPSSPPWTHNNGLRVTAVPTGSLLEMVNYRFANAQELAARATKLARESRAAQVKLDKDEIEANEALEYWTRRAEAVALLEERMSENESDGAEEE